MGNHWLKHLPMKYSRSLVDDSAVCKTLTTRRAVNDGGL